MAKTLCQEEELCIMNLSLFLQGVQKFQNSWAKCFDSSTNRYVLLHLGVNLLSTYGLCFGFSGEFCLPQFDPKFLIVPEFLKDDWLKSGVVGEMVNYIMLVRGKQSHVLFSRRTTYILPLPLACEEVCWFGWIWYEFYVKPGSYYFFFKNYAVR